jgi:prefoldin subunit 5
MVSQIGGSVSNTMDGMQSALNTMRGLDPEKDQKQMNELQNKIKLLQISLDILKEAQNSAAKSIETVTRAVRTN